MTPGGIALPQAAQKNPPCGTVFAVGADVIDLREGDTAHFDQMYANKIMVEDEEFIVVPKDAILAIVRQ